ncbi:MAG: response regulator transcription factor [Chthoniobacteraceae bacterium]
MKKILVIEDHALMRRNIVTILEMEGYAAVAAGNGHDGLALAHSEHPDLILCDVMMPGMDGHEVLRILRATNVTAGVPFVFLTAKGEKHEVRGGMNLGADDYLVKPVTRDDLVASLTARFTRKQQQRPDFSVLFADAQPLESLGISPREAEVLLWVAQGKSNADIASILDLSPATVKRHVMHIFEKIGVENRSSAVLRALEVLQG